MSDNFMSYKSAVRQSLSEELSCLENKSEENRYQRSGDGLYPYEVILSSRHISLLHDCPKVCRDAEK